MKATTTVKIYTAALVIALGTIAGAHTYVTTGNGVTVALVVFLTGATFYLGWTTANLIRNLEK